uniref:Uncharacterized protein n=1 Tax=Rhizophora mucronata TaxID=61149 RepID=A0A2P2QKQ1_RHIMU
MLATTLRQNSVGSRDRLHHHLRRINNWTLRQAFWVKQNRFGCVTYAYFSFGS